MPDVSVHTVRIHGDCLCVYTIQVDMSTLTNQHCCCGLWTLTAYEHIGGQAEWTEPLKIQLLSTVFTESLLHTIFCTWKNHGHFFLCVSDESIIIV